MNAAPGARAGAPAPSASSDTPSAASLEGWQATRYFSSLDGLRALSVVLVMTHHAACTWLHPLHGYLGVTLFFVLSGFLITTLSLREEARRGRLHLRAFFVRRLFRIFPLYYAVLGLYCALFFFGAADAKRERFFEALPYYALYLQEIPGLLFAGDWPFEFSWSLGIEEKFYLVFPLLAFATPLLLRTRLAMTGALAVLTFAVPLLRDSLGPWVELVQPYHNILAGCVLALLLHDARTHRWFVWLRDARVHLVLGVLLLAALCWPTVWASAAFAPMAALFIGGIALANGAGVARVFAWRPLVWIGERSYAVYLLHKLVLNVTERAVARVFGTSEAAMCVALVAAVGGVCVVAEIAHRFLEKPLIDRGRAWSARLTAGAAA